MTNTTITPILAAASDALDALATSTIGRPIGSATRDAAPLAFERVLAAETDATVLAGASASRDRASGAAGEPQQVGRPEVPGATDPQPDHGRDDEHAVGRTRSRRGREATDTRPNDGTASADEAENAQAADAAPAAGTNETDTDGTADPAGDTEAVAAGKGHRKPLATNEAGATPDQTGLAAAALTPAVAGAQPGANPGATSGAADVSRSRNANAATPATPAIPAGKAADDSAVPATPATPAVPAHKAVPASPTTPAPAGAADRDAATATPVAGGPGAPAIAAATGSVAVAATRRDARSRGTGAVAKSNGAAGQAESSSVDHDPDLPTTASDVARARASIARIVAAGADDAVDPRHHGAGAAATGPQVAVPAANVVAATPAADAALAAIAAAGQASPATSPATTATPATTAASAAAPAADRLALEAIDRIRTTVTAGVPGLESRIDDPELGTIRVVVSARLGETIRAEIVARDPAAARELASGIDRALAAGATLPGNVDLRVRSEAAASAARPDAHLGQRGGEHQPQDQSSAGGAFGGRADSGAGGAPGGDPGRVAPTHVSALTPANGRSRGVGPVPVAASSIPGALRPGTALDVRA